jgi:hypothetical protein
MSYEVVFYVFLGILALLGLMLIIIFWLVFRNDKTIHPIYRSHVSPANPKVQDWSVQVADAQGNTLRREET